MWIDGKIISNIKTKLWSQFSSQDLDLDERSSLKKNQNQNIIRFPTVYIRDIDRFKWVCFSTLSYTFVQFDEQNAHATRSLCHWHRHKIVSSSWITFHLKGKVRELTSASFPLFLNKCVLEAPLAAGSEAIFIEKLFKF